ncbi:amino acid adenylation domain-containing protein [Fulvivirga maritima]|uniref:amino acid adenylation domain-containing protein n=1 Tax=Fulvivirga maritima TaxID=2904247 RepID=UPI0021038878|nr:amino acid adenylation domain-containing protein [Fulvivirga maritima]
MYTNNYSQNHLFPATNQQEGIWFHAFTVAPSYWNFIEMRGYDGNIDSNILKNAFHQVIIKHSALRTHFVTHKNELFQEVSQQVNVDEIFIVNQLDVDDDEYINNTIKSVISQEEQYVFDLREGTLVRLRVLRFSNKCCLILNAHHIITDSESMAILWSDLISFYNTANEQVFESNVTQYKDYSIAQRTFNDSDHYQKELSYWKEKLGYKNSFHLDFHGGQDKNVIDYERATISSELRDRIRTIALRKRVLTSAVYQTAYILLLYIYSKDKSIIIENVIGGRGFGRNEYKDTIGLFANRVLNHQAIDPDCSISDLIKTVNAEILKSFKHSTIPFDLIKRELGSQDVHLNPFRAVFNVIKGFNDSSSTFLDLKPIEFNWTNSVVGDIQVDIGLTIVEDVSDTEVRLDVKVASCFLGLSKLMTANYLKLLEACVYHSEAYVNTLNILSVKELSLIDKFNNLHVDYPEASLISLFEKQAERKPNNIAVIFGETRLTYHELFQQVNQLCNYLIGNNLNADVIAVYTERSMDMIISILAILKLGSAYVPIDPEYPEGRVQYILNKSGADVVLTHYTFLHQISTLKEGVSPVYLDRQKIDILKSHKEFKSNCRASGLAYIIFTSGSTGKPKAVPVRHKNVTNTILAHIQEWRVNDDDVMLQFSSLAFDASVNEIFIALSAGIPLVLTNKLSLLQKSLFTDLLKTNSISLAILTPAYLRMLNVEDLGSLRVITSAGETPDVKVLTELSKNVICYNAYGPTECAICATMYQVKPYDVSRSRLPIGKPIANTSISIIDEAGSILPIGVAGEIIIKGRGVVAGYLNDTENSSNPFQQQGNSFIYKTGDLGRKLPSGDIEFLYRKDDQVKVRGFRVDLNEVRLAVKKCSDVIDAEVILKKDSKGSKLLRGCIISHLTSFDFEQLQDHLRKELPDYMIPAEWVITKELPVTSNGKVDKQALASLSPLKLTKYVEPANLLEKQLILIWQDILGIEQVGVADHFFRIGGHSLLATRLITSLQNELSYSVSIKEIFDYPVLRAFAQRLIELGESTIEMLPKVNLGAKIPLSYQQESIWVIDQLTSGNSQYNIPMCFKITGELNLDKLQQSFIDIIDRHTPLRTVIYQDELGKPYQGLLNSTDWGLKVVEGQELDGVVSSWSDFDLTKDFMIKAIVIAKYDKEFELIINVHHIAFDGWSSSIFFKELSSLYHGENIEKIEHNYQDYSQWQREKIISEKCISYWSDKLKGVEPLQLPTDFARPEIYNSEGNSIFVSLDQPIVSALYRISETYDITIYNIFLSVFSVLISRFSRQHDFCVGVPFSGREAHPSIEDLIGYFSNTLLVRCSINEDISFVEYAQSIKKQLLKVQDH